VYPHTGDLTNLAEYPPLKPNIIFCYYLLDHTLQKKSISATYLISITSLLENEQTSKHGEGGRYNAILEFKGEKIKK
jgi:hypothetical protein